MSYFSWKGAGRRRRASADRARPRSGREKAGPESTPPPGHPTSPWKAVQAWRGRRRAAGADRGRGRPCQTSGSASRANVVRVGSALVGEPVVDEAEEEPDREDDS